jgi:hypothetical protein
MNRFLFVNNFKWLPNSVVVELQRVLNRTGGHLRGEPSERK